MTAYQTYSTMSWNYFGFDVIVDEAQGQRIYRTKKWRRLNRLPKVRTRCVGRTPVCYRMGNKLIVNPEMLTIMKNESNAQKPTY